ncbi:PREDICTED: natterin-4-like [Nicrophorus vespilloides]|uniref:Natterin-4-like n=1 Tax=Nicrophorus vespilloides TaxID=110193 RepID=A0ABM1N8Z6_NICVS|nr:PREDICTED: natterin-4-like [Nicrophorus vespilloides]
MENRPYGFNPELFPPDPNTCPPSLSYPPHCYPPSPQTECNDHQQSTGFLYEKRKGYYWVRGNCRSGVPNNAVKGGMDQDGSTIFVGRAEHEGDYIPAKVIPDRNEAYVAYGGEEHSKTEFDILCEQRFRWEVHDGGDVPYGAVEGGRTCDGEKLYIGRVHHEGSHTVGKVHPSHGCCYIPFGGEEIKYEEYEILVLE